MRQLNRRTERICLFLVFLCLLALSGCRHKKQQEISGEGVYTVYYKNQSGTKLMSENYRAAGTDDTTLVRELLGEMRVHPEEIELVSVFPENLSVAKYEREGAFLTLYFDSLYTELDPVSEILLRAAVVKTMCQIPGVSYVSFYVNDQPLMDANGAPAGIMQADTFVENLNENLESMQPVTLILYFANQEGDLLYETERTVLYNSDIPLEKLVVNQLIQGPSSDDFYPTLPENLTLLGIVVKDGICYVDFDSSFISGALDVKDYIPIYSVVNSLSELTNVSKVQITINGSTNVKFRENISFSTVFERNLDYVGGMEN